MANLVSPGVSVTVTDESFFIPAAAATVPLFFVATADEKKRPDGIVDAAGTFESNVIRTVTSLKQSTELYGVPTFLEDVSGNPYHGDVRNEYGVFALNQYLGVGDLAYVVRANVNLNDNLTDIRTAWDVKMQESAYVLENLVNAYLNEWNGSNGFVVSAGATAIGTVGSVVPGLGYTPGTYSNVPLTGGSGYGATANITVTNTSIASFNNTTIVPGSGYAAGTYPAVALTGGTGTGATANITVTSSAIATLGAITAGSGYTAGTYNGLVLTGGTGTGATANIVVTNTTSIGTLSPVLDGGAGYTAGSYTAVPLTGGAGAGTAEATILVENSAIATAGLQITAPGTLYANNFYAAVPLTTVSGAGTGAVAEVTVSGGAVTLVTIIKHGIGYAISDTLTIPSNLLGGTGSGLLLTVSAVTGGVKTVTLTDRGTGYLVGDTLGVDDLTFAGGAGAGFTIDVATMSGAVTGVTIVNKGVGYAIANVLTATLPGGSGFSVPVATTSGAVTDVDVVARGTGYVIGDVLGVNNMTFAGGLGTGFSIPVVAVTGGVATVAMVNRGLNYTLGDVLTAGLVPGSGFTVTVATLTGYKTTVDQATVMSLASSATQSVWESFSFQNSESSYMDDWSSAPKPVYPNGYDAAPVGTYVGLEGIATDWVINASGSVVTDEWTAMEAGNMLLGAADAFKYTTDFLSQTSLGANDAARRVAVVTAMQAAINSNTDIRSEAYEYNLILCPGFPEVVDEMLNLCIDIQEEAMVIADTPFDKDPDDVAIWAATSDRRSSRNIAYYYPHGLASNLDGKDVFIAASGTALRTITYSDDVSELWFAPAGTRRGLVSGVSQVGYVSGTLGTPTTFVEVALNQGQRNNLYKYFTNINPIVFFPGRGIIVWGQKTSAPDASAMDRINVVRLIAYIKRQLRKNTMSYVFEPNDQLTRDNIKATVDSFLGDLIVKRGLYDFATVCDESNNTPDRIDRNELYVDIALKPVRAAEFIYIPIRVVATGAEI